MIGYDLDRSCNAKTVEKIQFELQIQVIHVMICIKRKEIEKLIPPQIVNEYPHATHRFINDF